MTPSHGTTFVSVANLYKDPSFRSEIVSQALLGEDLVLLQNQEDFVFVSQIDGYEGWMSKYQWISSKMYAADKIFVSAHQDKVYREPNNNSQQIRDVVLGSQLIEIGSKNGWINIILPDEKIGWIREESCKPFLAFSREAVKKFALDLLGYPYFWGGRSPKGFDCSGFTQTIFNLLGKKIPRDSWMQHQNSRFLSSDPSYAEIGDLYFFAENKKSITHVGIALGQGKIIHVRGVVRVDNLFEHGEDALLKSKLMDVRTFF